MTVTPALADLRGDYSGEYFDSNGICFASPLTWFGAIIPLTIAAVFTMKRLEHQSLAGR